VAKKIISYKLNQDGTIPDYVGDGGYLPKDCNTPDMILLGISKDGADISGAVSEFANLADVIAYVGTYLSDTTFNNQYGEERIFVVEEAVLSIFSELV
jgi:hypothetical protein